MFGDNPFAVPISSFQRPVPLVLVDPDDEPDYNVCFRKEWLPYILGSLQQLWLQTTWDTTDPDALALEQDRAKLLTSMFLRGCEVCEAELPLDSGCVDFPTDSSVISYAPQDPFTNPDYIPPGYIAVPFLVVTEGNILSFFPGAEIGDVISGYLSIPVLTPGIGQGLARFRVRTKGTGVVELHLLKVPAGGSVLITTDDDPLTVRTINLNKDVFQLPIETIGEITVEVPITTSGEHHIDVTFVPRFNDELIFISYGGGLRKVVLCGFDQTIDEAVDERARHGTISIDEEPELGLRINPDKCWIIQRECSPGEWVDWFDARCGIPGAIEQPTNGTALLPGECREWDVTLSANQKWLVPVAVSEGDLLQVTGASGGWNDGTAAWYCPTGQHYGLGACGGNEAAHMGDLLMSVNHMRLLMNVDGLYVDGYNAIYPVQPGVSDGQVEFLPNDGSLGDNSGTISFHVKLCKQEAAPTLINITYPFGSGPSTVTPGQYITVRSGCCGGGGAGSYGVNPLFDQDVKMTVISSSGFAITPCSGHGLFGGIWADTYGGTLVTGYYCDVSQDPASIAPTVGKAYEIECGTGALDFTITMLIELP